MIWGALGFIKNLARNFTGKTMYPVKFLAKFLMNPRAVAILDITNLLVFCNSINA
jgi:hypothetical protein